MSNDDYKILIIDDEKELREYLSLSLQLEDYEVDEAENGAEALNMIIKNKYDCIISDIEMPKITGIELLKRIKEIDRIVPVIMLTGVKNLKTVVNVMRLGAQDYLIKPIDEDGLKLSVKKAIDIKNLREQNLKLMAENKKYQKQLEKMVEKRTGQLEEAIFGSLNLLASSVEAKDLYTKGHSSRVKLISVDIAKAYGLPQKEISILEHGAMLHDIGKIGIQDKVLLKPGRLTDEEYNIIKQHPTIGERIVRGIKFFEPMLPLIRYHHERYDGKGYPDGLKGNDIPVLARIIAVADTYDAMTTTRPYRSAMPKEKALAILEEIKGTQLDAQFVDIFMSSKLYEKQYEDMDINVNDVQLNAFFHELEKEVISKPESFMEE